MAAPTAQTVADFLGQGDDVGFIALAEEHLPMVTHMVNAYTRGKGFTDGIPDDDVAAVIVSSVARLVVNPEQYDLDTAGPFTTRYRVFDGWSLPELAVLHRYRKRAL
ncbi:hypothetical protein ncot_13455 [Nocardioides sp. JQ2195]|uniref:hypothetical protein n=1 Tax=Nocardioides sp. JQ2195 TaxID=2592334 RepID=UPI00143E34F8|nr:hypothetical protein [Nocardioides sp. JQ2195]QIX27503.1 hypothetical protein ncot_13455 [Nocardioides sp. JQ2195]